MSQLFITVLNMSLTAGYCIVAVILLRIFLKKQPKLFSYLLWSVVLFRLLCPVSLSSNYSLLRMDTDIISQEKIENGNAEALNKEELNTLHGEEMMMQTSDAAYGNAGIRSGEESAYAEERTWMQKGIAIAAWVWLCGIVLLLVYSIRSAYKLNRLLKGAVRIGDNLYEAENIATPFVYGIIRPRIYLPAHLQEGNKKYVLAHEKVHIARKDYLIKLVAYAAVCIHWFNPLVWLAFVLMENDMEMSCDEAVIKKMGTEIKKEYSLSLLALSSERAVFQGGPIAFGEGKVKGRIRNILAYRKKTVLTVLLAAVILLAVGVGLLLNPARAEQIGEEEQEKITVFVEAYADAHCNRDGAAIAAFYVDEETAFTEEADRLLEKDGEVYTYGFSSPWPYTYRYEMIWEGKKADIRYYAWTSDPHVAVWREEIQYTKVGEEYRVSESSWQMLDAISSEEEFREAYWINGEYQFIDYVGNGFVDAIRYQIETGTSSADNTVYEKPETAAAYILNLTGGEGTAEISHDIVQRQLTDGSDVMVETEDVSHARVKYRFADGSEVEIPMYMPLAAQDDNMGAAANQGEAIWIVDTAHWNSGA